MSYINDVFGQPIYKDLGKMFIGLDDHFNRLSKVHSDLSKSANYPPYNIRRLGETQYVVEIAAAGFNEEEFDITFDNRVLIVKANVEHKEENDFLFKGIAKRAFTRSFALDDNVEVKAASFVNGILSINLEKIVPDSHQPKRIAINSASKKNLLLE